MESWLLVGVPIPAALLARVWPDPGWRSCLRHLVVIVDGRAGVLTEVSEEGRTRLTDKDGSPHAPPVGPVTVPPPLCCRTRVTTSPLGTDGTHVGLRVSRDRSTGRFRYQRIDGADGVDG
ncbi:hypothetical protein ACH4S9_00610 [Streptomyces sp. NPDC021225]|uniref:hypothetical protein n=1 Tax=Streptomyces sp. NPDC021225 TaxID=3365121 RepID=UPI00378D9E80